MSIVKIKSGQWVYIGHIVYCTFTHHQQVLYLGHNKFWSGHWGMKRGYSLDGMEVRHRQLCTHTNSMTAQIPTKLYIKIILCYNTNTIQDLLFYFITITPFTAWCYAILAPVQMQAIISGWCQGGEGNANHNWNQCGPGVINIQTIEVLI